MSEYTTVPAGRNIVHDPKPAAITYATYPEAGLSLVTDESYAGTHSLFLNAGASAGTKTFEWKAANDDDADLTAIPAGSRIEGVLHVKRTGGNFGGIPNFRVTYTDGTFDETPLANFVISSDFVRVRAPIAATAAGKTVRNISWLVGIPASATFVGYFGGFGVRVNETTDSFIHGDAGPGYSWEGAANNSPSRRTAFVVTPIFGGGGQYTPTLTAEIVSRQGAILGDITDHLLDGSITYDLEADQHKGSCNVTLDEPGLIEVLGDEWLRISLRIERPDGTVEEGPLGVFILEPPKERWTEGADQWTYTGKDITALLSTTFIRGGPRDLILPKGEEEVTLLAAYLAEEGTPYRAILEDVLLNDVGLRRSQFSFAADLPQFLDTDMGWEPVASVMEIVADTLEGAGWMSPWATTAGIITSAKAGVNPATVSPSIVLATGNNSRVRWPFEVDAETGGIGNRVRVISARDVRTQTGVTKKKRKKKGGGGATGGKPIYSTRRHAVEVWRMNNDPSHPLSFARLGRWIDLPDVETPLVQSVTEAEALANQALIEGGQLPMRVRLTTEAMVRSLNEVYELNLNDHWGDPIASGQGRYWCRGWSIQLGPPWEMVHNLSRTIDFAAASFL